MLKISKHFFASVRHYSKGICTTDHRNKITAVTSEVVESVLSDKSFTDASWIATDLKKAIDYSTLSGGKKLRSAITIDTYENYETPDKVKEKLNLAYVVAACAELFEANIIILDDVQDESMFRYSKPCWHRLPDVGLRAINDANIILALIYEIIEKYFRNDKAFTDLILQVNKALLHTYTGQHMDYVSSQTRKDYSQFTMERYEAIVYNKTTFYTFNFPLNLGLILANVRDEKLSSDMDRICKDFGKMYQMQNDYYDVYGDFSLTGKYGTDISENQCTWLAVTALQRCNADQRAIFSSCYGSKEPEHVNEILKLYTGLKLDKVYREETRKLHDKIESRIHELPTSARIVFHNIFNIVSADIIIA